MQRELINGGFRIEASGLKECEECNRKKMTEEERGEGREKPSRKEEDGGK